MNIYRVFHRNYITSTVHTDLPTRHKCCWIVVSRIDDNTREVAVFIRLSDWATSIENKYNNSQHTKNAISADNFIIILINSSSSSSWSRTFISQWPCVWRCRVRCTTVMLSRSMYLKCISQTSVSSWVLCFCQLYSIIIIISSSMCTMLDVCWLCSKKGVAIYSAIQTKLKIF